MGIATNAPWFKWVPPPEYIHMREYALLHDVSYSLLYSRVNGGKLKYARKFGRYYILKSTDPAQFRTGAYAK